MGRQAGDRLEMEGSARWAYKKLVFLEGNAKEALNRRLA